jgi:hypothetical protein
VQDVSCTALPAAAKKRTRSGAVRRWSAATLMIASGLAGLGYQIVWTQQSALWLGHEAAAVLAVITAVFGGMGVVEDARAVARLYINNRAQEGSTVLGELQRTQPARPEAEETLRVLTGVMP